MWVLLDGSFTWRSVASGELRAPIRHSHGLALGAEAAKITTVGTLAGVANLLSG